MNQDAILHSRLNANARLGKTFDRKNFYMIPLRRQPMSHTFGSALGTSGMRWRITMYANQNSHSFLPINMVIPSYLWVLYHLSSLLFVLFRDSNGEVVCLDYLALLIQRVTFRAS